MIRTSYQLDAKLKLEAPRNDAFAAGRLLQPYWYGCVHAGQTAVANSIETCKWRDFRTQ